MPDYEHTRLGNCFRTTCDLIIRLLEGISAGPRFVTRFQFNDPYWKAEIPLQILEEAKTSGGQFWLVPSFGKHRPGRTVQFGSTIAQTLLPRRHEIPSGTGRCRASPLTPVGESSSGMPRMQGALYFRIGREAPLWAEVEKDGQVCMHWTDAPEDLDAQLALLAKVTYGP